MQDAKGLTRGINQRFSITTFSARHVCVNTNGIKKVTHRHHSRSVRVHIANVVIESDPRWASSSEVRSQVHVCRHLKGKCNDNYLL